MHSHLPARFRLRPLAATIACVCLCLLANKSAPAAEAVPASVRYQVSFPEVQAHYVHVAMRLPNTAEEPLVLFLPVWTPGSYLVREYARHIDGLEAQDSDGNALQIRKSTKNTWTIDQPPVGEIRLKYRVYCNELSVRTNFVDSEFGVLNGAATYLTTEALLAEPHLVEFALPPQWQQAVSAMKRPPVGSPPHSFLATNYDELVDSPTVLGNPTLHPFEVAGVNHFLVNLGGDGLWDGDRAAADAAKIVAEHQAMWASVPYDRYYFLNVIAESGGGLEHDHCSLLMTGRWSFRSPSSYQRWLGLVSHEFFHTWNVRRLRPAGLQRYDYVDENYFDELWVAEGITSYYDSLAVARAELTTANDYLGELSRQITTLQTTPGRLRQSLAESSHDAWIKFYRPDENSSNTSISYYNKGAIVAFLLDIEIRRRTENAHSLDDVMRTLFRDYSSTGYTNQDVQTVSSQIVGEDLGEWFASHIESTDELDYQPALDWLGLEFSRPAQAAPAAAKQGTVNGSSGEAKSAESDASPSRAGAGEPKKADGSQQKKEKPAAEDPAPPARGSGWLGVSASSQDGRLTVTRVLEGSPGFQAGLNVDDELIAIDGFRLGTRLNDRLQEYAAGDRVEILYSRRGKLRKLEVALTPKPASTWRIARIRKPSELQKESFEKWLAGSQP